MDRDCEVSGMMKCEKCKYGIINFWGYAECWKFNWKLDQDTTSETANRERTARMLNYYVPCIHFKRKSIFRRIFT